MSSAFHPATALDNTLGAVFIGVTLAGILYGITCVQSYTYFKNNRDNQWFKRVISFLWILDTLHQALAAQNMYISLVSDFGNYDFLISHHSNPAALALFYVSETSDLIIRGIFLWRVWIISAKNIYVAICIATTSLLSFASVLAFLSSNFDGDLSYFLKVSYLLYIGLASGMAADIFIAVFLCINLWQRRSGLKKTDSLVRALIKYSVNTALLTTISHMACLITYAAMHDNFVWMAIYHILSKLLLNSLLASLNSRDALSEKGGVISVVVSSSGSDLSMRPNGPRNSKLPVAISGEVHRNCEIGNAI